MGQGKSGLWQGVVPRECPPEPLGLLSVDSPQRKGLSGEGSQREGSQSRGSQRVGDSEGRVSKWRGVRGEGLRGGDRRQPGGPRLDLKGLWLTVVP